MPAGVPATAPADTVAKAFYKDFQNTNGRAPRPDQCEAAAQEFVTAKRRQIYLEMDATAGAAALGTPAWASEFYRSCEVSPSTSAGGFSAGGEGSLCSCILRWRQ